jgi:hypothetical protein
MQRCLQVQTAIDRDTACYRILYLEKNFLLISSLRKVMRYVSHCKTFTRFPNELCTEVGDYLYICLVADSEKPHTLIQLVRWQTLTNHVFTIMQGNHYTSDSQSGFRELFLGVSRDVEIKNKYPIINSWINRNSNSNKLLCL